MADPEEPVNVEADAELFSGLKKKKKKKAGLEDAPEPTDQTVPSTSEETPEDSGAIDDSLTFGLKKKKKKKLPVDLDADVAEEKPAETVADLSADLEDLDLKKKKKKKKDLAAFEEELEEDKKPSAADEGKDEQDGDEDDQEVPEDDMFAEDDDPNAEFVKYETDLGDDPMEALQGTDRDYQYQELLGRAFRLIRIHNPDYGDKKRYTMIPPQVMREGAKKTIFVNLSDICKRMRRQPDHVAQFLFAELGTSGSIDGNQRLVIKGRFQPKQIEKVLRSYILEYVACKICRSPDTVLVKENRLLFVQCESCNSTRSVAAVKTGFSAQIGRRKR